MQQRPNVNRDLKNLFKGNDVLKWLIVINVAVMLIVWLLVALLPNPMPLNAGYITYWMGATSNMGALLYKPWSIITYMFMHDIDRPFHLILNMVVLYFSGKIFVLMLGQRKLLSLYFVTGIGGWILFAICYNIFPAFEIENMRAVPLVGASAAVYGILVAAAVFAPDMEVRLFGVLPIQFKWIAIIIVIADLATIGQGNPGGKIAHLGGELTAALFMFQLKRRRDFLEPVNRFLSAIGSIFKPKPKIRVEYRNPNQRRTGTPRTKGKSAPSNTYKKTESAASKDEHQRRIDVILDKISKSGYDSLSKAEKEYLFKNSNNS